MKGFGWSKALHPQDIESLFKGLKQLNETKTKIDGECRIRRFDGVYREFLVRAAPVLNDDGSILECVGVFVDLTERNQIQRKTNSFASDIENLVKERRIDQENEQTAPDPVVLELAENPTVKTAP